MVLPIEPSMVTGAQSDGERSNSGQDPVNKRAGSRVDCSGRRL
jgi:hypothetical protein